MKKSQPAPVTRLKRIAVAVVMSLGTTPVSANMLAISAGGGNLTTHQSNAAFLSYQKKAPSLFKRESLYDFTIGHWNGPTANSAITVARVVRWRLPSPGYYFAGMLGIGLVSQHTDHLGTDGQFIIRLSIGHKFGKYELSIGETHYSNGKYLLNLPWDGDNEGENFTTVMLAREL